jgi:RNase adapter protein RapZ
VSPKRRARPRGARGSAHGPQRRRHPPQVLVITGLSGSGKTHVARALEDLGWFCVDNLPTALIPRFAELIRKSPELRRFALVVDLRERDFLRQFPPVFRRLRESGLEVSLLFLESDERALVRRFSETRRPHPLAVNEPVVESIRQEREALTPIRKMADMILDTSEYTVHQLRDYIREHYEAQPGAPMVVSVLSFGYKFGVPPEADLVFDVRFLPNPNFVPRLKPLTGNHAPVVRYLRKQKQTEAFLRRLSSFLSFLMPQYMREGKSYLTIAVGCTGGRHRSVMIANAVSDALNRALDGNGVPVKVRHRDLRHGGAGAVIGARR